MNRKELIQKVYDKAREEARNRRAEYYRINPTPITMDDGEIVNVEWIQPSYFGGDVLINYRTDGLKATMLSENELEQLLNVI